MTAGHFGFAAAVKSSTPRVPLWALMLATYLLDVIFIVLAGFGIESFAPLDPARPSYGNVVIHAYYTHSLVGALAIAAVAGWLARRAWGRTAGIVIGVVTFSHWVLDLVVHRPDMPVLPGNALGLPLLGFGLWRVPVASALVELALVLTGWYLYSRRARSAPAALDHPGRARVASGTTGVLMVLLLAADYFGAPIMMALLLMVLLIVLCGWLDARLEWARDVRD